MRRFSTLVLLTSLLIAGFVPQKQVTATTLLLLERTGQITTEITDGDTIMIQISLSQTATQDTPVNFSLEDGTPVGTCMVTVNASACLTDPFPALGWYWGPSGKPHNTVHL